MQTTRIESLSEFLRTCAPSPRVIPGKHPQLAKYDPRLPSIQTIVSPSGRRRAEIHFYQHSQAVIVYTRRNKRWVFKFGFMTDQEDAEARKALPRYIDTLFRRRRLR